MIETTTVKIQKFNISTKTYTPTGLSGATGLPPIGDSFMYIETSSDNHGNGVTVSFERTDIIQTNNMSFHYNIDSTLPNDLLKSIGRFRIQLLLGENTGSRQYNIPKNDRFSLLSTQRTLVSLTFTVEAYGKILKYDQIHTPHVDLCFSILQ